MYTNAEPTNRREGGGSVGEEAGKTGGDKLTSCKEGSPWVKDRTSRGYGDSACQEGVDGVVHVVLLQEYPADNETSYTGRRGGQ